MAHKIDLKNYKSPCCKERDNEQVEKCKMDQFVRDGKTNGGNGKQVSESSKRMIVTK